MRGARGTSGLVPLSDPVVPQRSLGRGAPAVAGPNARIHARHCLPILTYFSSVPPLGPIAGEQLGAEANLAEPPTRPEMRRPSP